VPATRDRRDAIALDAAEEDGGADDALATTARRFETRAGAATRAEAAARAVMARDDECGRRRGRTGYR
jgi:hypothetical protein